jgi:hypothetical protein
VSVAESFVPFNPPEIVAVVLLEPFVVFTVKVADVFPAAMFTDAATWAAGMLLDKLIETPPDGAGPLIFTVPVDEDPPLTVAGLRVSDTSVSG